MEISTTSQHGSQSSNGYNLLHTRTKNKEKWWNNFSNKHHSPRLGDCCLQQLFPQLDSSQRGSQTNSITHLDRVYVLTSSGINIYSLLAVADVRLHLQLSEPRSLNPNSTSIPHSHILSVTYLPLLSIQSVHGGRSNPRRRKFIEYDYRTLFCIWGQRSKP